MKQTDVILSCRDLSFSYKLEENRQLDVLHDISLEVDRGEILCLLGPSGCGKSTLLKLLSGFLTPPTGGVFRRDIPVTAPFREGQMIFQDSDQLFPWLRTGQNIKFPQESRGMGQRLSAQRSMADPKLEIVLRETGLADFADFYPSQLSGGMKQRCALARALYKEPEILYMDEPFASLDAPSRRELQNLLLSLWEEREQTILFVTHDIAEALILADRIVIMAEKGAPFCLEENRLPRPRRRQEEKFLKEEARYYSLLESSLGTR